MNQTEVVHSYICSEHWVYICLRMNAQSKQQPGSLVTCAGLGLFQACLSLSGGWGWQPVFITTSNYTSHPIDLPEHVVFSRPQCWRGRRYPNLTGFFWASRRITGRAKQDQTWWWWWKCFIWGEKAFRRSHRSLMEADRMCSVYFVLQMCNLKWYLLLFKPKTYYIILILQHTVSICMSVRHMKSLKPKCLI